ncbi:MAG TPA: NAD-dependent epimerase/dehydratase family protein [Solirubrobacteraceae bacterium]|jgi:UDP-glucose 4-epimerase|nr:NAD-dependent epimerase/dehydratase family protein [Solirubrobacteraceae bacterium]
MSSPVIVTGGAGFIGSHVADALLAQGHEVTVVDDLSAGSAAKVPAAARLVELDIVDRSALERVFDEVRPAAVYHLAAQASVTASVADPLRDCAVNVQGTLNVVDLATKLGAPVSFTSTGGALYGDDVPMPTGEDTIPSPLAPYGASKLAGEAYVKTWSLFSGVPHAVCRLGNVYGPRQSPHGEAGVVAIFSEHLHSGRAPKMFGHGTPTRDYIYVGDVVSALIAANGHSGTFNVATGVETDVATLWRVLRDEAGADVEPELRDLRPGELGRSCLDCSLAERELRWRAAMGIDQGLRRTYAALVDEFVAAG